MVDGALTRISEEQNFTQGPVNSGLIRGERPPRNTKPANEGGPVSRQSRGISEGLATQIIPQIAVRRKPPVGQWRCFA